MSRKVTNSHLKLVHSTSDAKIQREIRRKQREFEKTLPPMPKKVIRELKKLGFQIKANKTTVYGTGYSDPKEVPWFYFEKKIDKQRHYIEIHPKIDQSICRWLKCGGRIETTHRVEIITLKWIDYEYGPNAPDPEWGGRLAGSGADFNKDPIIVTLRDAPVLVEAIWPHLYELQKVDD